MTALSVVLICPDGARRSALSDMLRQQGVALAREFDVYPGIHPEKVAEWRCDAVLVEVESDRETALDVIEVAAAAGPAITVMAYARSEEPDLLVRCMRAGAREFLSDPLSPAALAEALVHAAARRPERTPKVVRNGKLLAFVGAKGGVGTTTLAINFAIALKRESGGRVLLLDLHPQLGDVAVALGLQPAFTLLDALRHADRLDHDFLSTLLIEHKTGVEVLASADEFATQAPALRPGDVSKLLYQVRETFDYVVADAGSDLGAASELLFELADTVYIVTQADVPGLRRTQRMIAKLRAARGERTLVVLNRFDPRKSDIDEASAAKALGVAPAWKAPNDYAAARRSLNTGEPLMLESGPLARFVAQMANQAAGKSNGETKKKFSIFGV